VSPGRRVFFVFTAVAPCWAAWLDVPFIAQEKNGCGSAALAMTIRYWGKPADAARIQRELYSPAEKGIPATAIRRYLEARGFEAHVFRGEWQDLRHHLSQGRPLIVCFRPARKAALHYAVAAGADDHVVALKRPRGSQAPQMGSRPIRKSWRAAGFWTLLAVPRAIP